MHFRLCSHNAQNSLESADRVVGSERHGVRGPTLTCQIMDRIVEEPLFQMTAGDGRGDAFTEVESLDVTTPGSDRPLPP